MAYFFSTASTSRPIYMPSRTPQPGLCSGICPWGPASGLWIPSSGRCRPAHRANRCATQAFLPYTAPFLAGRRYRDPRDPDHPAGLSIGDRPRRRTSRPHRVLGLVQNQFKKPPHFFFFWLPRKHPAPPGGRCGPFFFFFFFSDAPARSTMQSCGGRARPVSQFLCSSGARTAIWLSGRARPRPSLHG